MWSCVVALLPASAVGVSDLVTIATLELISLVPCLSQDVLIVRCIYSRFMFIRWICRVYRHLQDQVTCMCWLEVANPKGWPHRVFLYLSS